ncbi:hypothetical protein D3C72_2129500 [compost metagenome]
MGDIELRHRGRHGIGVRKIRDDRRAPRHGRRPAPRQSVYRPTLRQQMFRQGAPDNAAGSDDKCVMTHAMTPVFEFRSG